MEARWELGCWDVAAPLRCWELLSAVCRRGWKGPPDVLPHRGTAAEQRRFFCPQLGSRMLLLVKAPGPAAPGSCREEKGLFALQ